MKLIVFIFLLCISVTTQFGLSNIWFPHDQRDDNPL